MFPHNWVFHNVHYWLFTVAFVAITGRRIQNSLIFGVTISIMTWSAQKSLKVHNNNREMKTEIIVYLILLKNYK